MEKRAENLSLLKGAVKEKMKIKGYCEKDIELVEKALNLGFYTGVFTETENAIDGKEFAQMTAELF